MNRVKEYLIGSGMSQKQLAAFAKARGFESRQARA